MSKEKVFKQEVYERFFELMKLREGQVIDKDTGMHRVYKDSLGKPTVGWGHLVLPSDNLKVGDLVPQSRVEAFFEKDSRWALDNAYKQAEELGFPENIDLIVILGSVNYQLGPDWALKFKNTYAHLKNKRYNKAINNLYNSLWFQQTPTRVEDFVKVIKTLK